VELRAGLPSPPSSSPQQSSPAILGGRLESRDASAGVAEAVAAIARGESGAVWVTYTVPAVRGRGEHHRSHEPGDRCVLGENGFEERGPWTSDDAGTLRVFVKPSRTGVDRVVFTDAACVVDAGRQTVIRLEGVSPADSVRWLTTIVGAAERGAPDGHAAEARDSRKGALVVIALTDDASADEALTAFVAPDRPAWLRRDAAFWLGASRGAAGASVITRLAKSDADEEFRKHLTFVLTLTGSTGIDTLIDLARHDASAGVRGQALFWLAQKAGQRAVSTLDGAVEHDPDSEVRKRAVFAISQLPRDEGVPMLIRLARTHRDPGVRKQAMFWLGQSGDTRALAFFEEVLAR
jgi:hypothetical protein